MIEIPFNTLQTLVNLANTMAGFKDLSRREEMHLSAAEALLEDHRHGQVELEKYVEESDTFGSW